MTRTHDRSPRGQCLIDAVPYGRWKTSTFLPGLRQDGLVAPAVFDGRSMASCSSPIELFLAYVAQILMPALRPGDIVVMDNPSSHKVVGVREAITAAGASLLYLPAYSPDLNPIEQAFAKLKALLRAKALRTVEALWNAIGDIVGCFTPNECRNYLRDTGYSQSG